MQEGTVASEREEDVLQRWGWDVLGASTEEEARDPCRWLSAPVNVATMFAEGTVSGARPPSALRAAAATALGDSRVRAGVKAGLDNNLYVR